MLSSNPPQSSIIRVWRGWTAPNDADAYESLLTSTIVPGIAQRGIRGHRSTRILRRDVIGSDADEVEFMTIMEFDDWEGVVEFAGGDGTPSVVPSTARALLSRFDEHSQHYRVVGTSPGPAA